MIVGAVGATRAGVVVLQTGYGAEAMPDAPVEEKKTIRDASKITTLAPPGRGG